jgi:hypothetical protein
MASKPQGMIAPGFDAILLTHLKTTRAAKQITLGIFHTSAETKR